MGTTPSSPSADPALATESIRQSAFAAAKTARTDGALERWFWSQQQRDIEAYLARSADIHDLEERMRNLERGRWHRYTN